MFKSDPADKYHFVAAGEDPNEEINNLLFIACKNKKFIKFTCYKFYICQKRVEIIINYQK